MKVSKLIKNLQQFIQDHGDLEAWYAKDDEGNGFQPVYCEPSVLKEDEDGPLEKPVCCIN